MSKKKKKNKAKKSVAAAEIKTEEVKSDEAVSSDEELIREAQSAFAPIPHSDSFTEKDFSESVASLDPESIALCEKDGNAESGKNKKKKTKADDIIQFAVFGICAVIAVVCIVMLIQNIYGKIRGSQIYNETDFDRFTIGLEGDMSFNHPADLLPVSGDKNMLTLYERIIAGKTPENNTSGEYSKKLDAMKASLTALKAKNADIYGWIYVENTGIDYPILRGKDNNYYLDHAYTGESLPIGSIFLDFHTADLITDNFNTVIYGHNVVTGAMFHDVTKFLEPKFFEANKIYIYTMDGVFIYKPVSVYQTSESYFYYRYSFLDENDFLRFAADVCSKSAVPSKEKISSGDTMITLSTCTNGGEGGRYALHAKLIETVK